MDVRYFDIPTCSPSPLPPEVIRVPKPNFYSWIKVQTIPQSTRKIVEILHQTFYCFLCISNATVRLWSVFFSNLAFSYFQLGTALKSSQQIETSLCYQLGLFSCINIFIFFKLYKNQVSCLVPTHYNNVGTKLIKTYSLSKPTKNSLFVHS